MRELFAGLVVALTLGVPPALANADVYLGSAAFNPSPYAKGFGWVEPPIVYNGGVPSGLIKRISWEGWGESEANGTGYEPIYKPVGGYFPSSARIKLKASNLGTCPDVPGPAYRRLLVRVPLWPGGPLGPWQAWNGNRSLCGDGAPDNWQPPGGGGYCGYTGEFDYPGEAKNILASRVGCAMARRVAQRSKGKVSPSPAAGPRRMCGRRGCRVRILGFRCRFSPIHLGDYSDSEGAPLSEPYQRVSCKRGQAGILWWYQHFFD